MSLDEQLHQVFRTLDQQVADHVRAHHPVPVRAPEPSRRRGRWLVPALGAVAVAALAVAAVIGPRHLSTDQPTPARTTTRTPAPPSQSPVDAARDRVLAGIAAMPFAARVHPIAPDSGLNSTEVYLARGVWVLSTFDPNVTPSTSTTGPCYGPDAAVGRRYQVCNPYGELLLLSIDRRQILRAYPLPLPPQWLVSGPTGLYVGRQGDGALTDSMVCRVASGSQALSCRDFQAPGLPDGPSYTAKQLAPWPGHWVIDRAGPAMSSARIAGGALVVSGPHQPSTRLDLVTLAVKSG